MDHVATAPKVTVRREIEASADELFDAWLDPASLAVWMRPGDVARAVARVDPRVGGDFEIAMHGSEGVYVHRGTYRVIDRPRRLTFTWVSTGTKHAESLVTVEFRAGPRRTEIVLTHERLPDEDAVRSHSRGWTRILERLAGTIGPARTA